MVSQDLAQARRAERGAQKLIDITAEGVPDRVGVRRSADEAGLGHAREISNAKEMDELINQAVHMDQDGEEMLSQPTNVPDTVMGVESSTASRQERKATPCLENLENQPELGMTLPPQRSWRSRWMKHFV